MRPSRPSLVAGTVFVLALFAAIAVPEMRDSWVWSVVGAIYAPTIGFVVVARRVQSRPLKFRETVGMAAVVVVVLVPLTVHMQAGTWGNFNPSFSQFWSVTLSLHFQRVVPVAFMFPLGVATTRRHQLGIVFIMLLPSMYELFDWFVLHPERFHPLYTSPFRLVISTGFTFLVLTALGSLLLLVGRRLSHEDNTRQKPVVRPANPHSE